MSNGELSVSVIRPFEDLGRLVMTTGVKEAIPIGEVLRALGRHQAGDWGDVPPEDARANDRALHTGERLLSSYRSAGGTRFWILTEADRSSTCVLLPEEY